MAGRSEVVAVYELLSLRGELTDEKRRVCELYAKGLALYRQARFQDALAVLVEAYNLDPTDGPTRALGHRCRQFLQSPPPMPFDGVNNLEK